MSTGLYRPEDVRDNCGFGLIAHMQGDASHKLLQTAIESLTCMTHRGGIAADGKTGDGCGLLLKKPDGFLRTVAKESCGSELSEIYGVGQIFLSRDEQMAASARDDFEAVLLKNGLQPAGWRVVPVDESVCGEIQACRELSRCLSMSTVWMRSNCGPAYLLFVAKRKWH